MEMYDIWVSPTIINWPTVLIYKSKGEPLTQIQANLENITNSDFENADKRNICRFLSLDTSIEQ